VESADLIKAEVAERGAAGCGLVADGFANVQEHLFEGNDSNVMGFGSHCCGGPRRNCAPANGLIAYHGQLTGAEKPRPSGRLAS